MSTGPPQMEQPVAGVDGPAMEAVGGPSAGADGSVPPVGWGVVGTVDSSQGAASRGAEAAALEVPGEGAGTALVAPSAAGVAEVVVGEDPEGAVPPELDLPAGPPAVPPVGGEAVGGASAASSDAGPRGPGCGATSSMEPE